MYWSQWEAQQVTTDYFFWVPVLSQPKPYFKGDTHYPPAYFTAVNSIPQLIVEKRGPIESRNVKPVCLEIPGGHVH
jgi:hypothetical protein